MPPGQSVFPCDFPDPMVLRSSGAWFAYATSTSWQHPGTIFPILRSNDLGSWRYVGDGLRRAPRWAAQDLWAPSVIRARRRFYLFYSARRRSDRCHCVAVAVSRRATGPFRDLGPVACKDSQGAGYIDPAPLRAPDGRVYLYFSVDRPHHSLSVIPLARDLTRPAGPRRELLRVARPWQRGLADDTVEGPFPVREGGSYTLYYSAGSWKSDYRMGSAVSSSPLGPFRDVPGNPFLGGSGPFTAPGGGSVFAGPGGPWLAFHAWTASPGYQAGSVRTLRIESLAALR